MKEIFIGSSSEAIDQVDKIGDELDKILGIKTLRWYKEFPLGWLTYEVIEKVASRVAGAIFIATPDDPSIVKTIAVKVPRANVMLELGYFSALLERKGVALCKYDETTLPTDLQAFTYVPMGKFTDYAATGNIKPDSMEKLKNWTNTLLETAESINSSVLMHGYSGRWQLNNTFEKWREFDIVSTDYVTSKSLMDLQIERDGKKGYGITKGYLFIRVKGYQAEVKTTDVITEVKCLTDGSLLLTTEAHSRECIYRNGSMKKILGIPDKVSDPSHNEWKLQPAAGESARLTGYNEMKSSSGYIYDRIFISATKIS